MYIFFSFFIHFIVFLVVILQINPEPNKITITSKKISVDLVQLSTDSKQQANISQQSNTKPLPVIFDKTNTILQNELKVIEKPTLNKPVFQNQPKILEKTNIETPKMQQPKVNKEKNLKKDVMLQNNKKEPPKSTVIDSNNEKTKDDLLKNDASNMANVLLPSNIKENTSNSSKDAVNTEYDININFSTESTEKEVIQEEKFIQEDAENLVEDENFKNLLDIFITEQKKESPEEVITDIFTDNYLSSDEKNSLKQQIEGCWINLGTVNEDDLILTLKITANSEAEIVDISIVKIDGLTINSNIDIVSLEQKITQAFSRPECAQLDLPLNKHDAWKRFFIKLNLKGFFR